MSRLPDDDGLVPPPKVLRKRLNGVYREDLGFSGPTRRYVLMVALLVGLASVPTLAVLTTGSNEISGQDRPGAMDAPFLPPPFTGPVGPAPSVPAKPSPSASSTEKDRPHSDRKWSQPKRSTSKPIKQANRSVRRSVPKSPVEREFPVVRDPIERNPVVRDLPIVRDLPVVPEENEDLPSVPDLPDVPSDKDVRRDLTQAAARLRDLARSASRHRDEPEHPDEPHPARRRPCEDAPVSESWSRRRAAGEPTRSTVHIPHSRRSAVTERPYNIRAARILERSYAGGGANTRRSMAQPRSEEYGTNRHYRGQHRAEQTHHADEWTPARQRDSRVGRHHADPLYEHRTNHHR